MIVMAKVLRLVFEDVTQAFRLSPSGVFAAALRARNLIAEGSN
jgi:hypothetical protein